MTILQLIASDSFITVNKDLIKLVGLEEAIIIGELASEHDYWQKRQEITKDGWFFSTIENIEDKTTLSEHKQRKAMKKLEQLGLISIQIKGLPAKRYVKINEDAVKDLLLNNSVTSSEKIKELDTENIESNNNIVNNNISNNNIDIKDTKKKAKDTSSSQKRISKKEQITEYINSLDYTEETKDYLFKWLFNIGLVKGVSLAQFTDMLSELWKSCNNETLFRESIKKSYLNNWFGFYADKKMSQNIQLQTSLPTATINTEKVALSNEVF